MISGCVTDQGQSGDGDVRPNDRDFRRDVLQSEHNDDGGGNGLNDGVFKEGHNWGALLGGLSSVDGVLRLTSSVTRPAKSQRSQLREQLRRR